MLSSIARISQNLGLTSEEVKEPPIQKLSLDEHINGFNVDNLKFLINGLIKYRTENGTKPPTPFWIVNKSISLIPGSKYIVKTNQEYADSAYLKILEIQGRPDYQNITKTKLMILEILDEVLTIYHNNSRGEVSTHIENAFAKFCMPMDRKQFDKMKEKLRAYINEKLYIRSRPIGEFELISHSLVLEAQTVVPDPSSLAQSWPQLRLDGRIV